MESPPSEHKKRKHKKTGAERPIEVLESGVAKLPSYSPHEEHLAEQNVDEDVLSIWIQLEGCDPVPVLVNSNMNVHDLKLLLGGFQSTSSTVHSLKINRMAQRQQIELLGLVGIRPQQLKLKVDNNPLAPPSLLRSVVSEGTIVHIAIVQSPVTTALTNTNNTQAQAPPSDFETQRFMNSVRHELEYLRRRVLAPSSERRGSAAGIVESSSSSAPGDPFLGSSEAVNRLELLEAKLDLKNSTFLNFLSLKCAFLTFSLYNSSTGNNHEGTKNGYSRASWIGPCYCPWRRTSREGT